MLIRKAGYCSAARWYVEGFSKRSNIQVRLHLASIGRLARPVEITLFRILRHSGSRVADIRLKRAGNAATLEVQDYGNGIPARLLDQFKRTGLGVGVGLMNERAD